jgi:DNA end-binding protein Ku
MLNPIWKGSLGFGLVNIPVALYAGHAEEALNLTLIDRRDRSPVGYRTVNKSTGQEVPRSEIAKGYEIHRDRFVLLEDADFERASPTRTKRIDILSTVDLRELAPAYFLRPYLLAPLEGGEQGYALLREALRENGRAAVGRVVVKNREHLCAIFPQGRALVVDLLRYAHEVKNPDELPLPDLDLQRLHLGVGELDLARRLVDDMAAPWDPAKYRDEYRDELMAYIERKAEAGEETRLRVPPPPQEPEAPPSDLVRLLRESVAKKAGGKARPESA